MSDADLPIVAWKPQSRERCGPFAWLGAARAPSPDVRVGHPARRSLECRRRFAIVAALGGIRRLPGPGQPLAEFVPVSDADGRTAYAVTLSETREAAIA